MIWIVLIAVLIGLPALTVFISGVVFYVQFRKSPERWWRLQVFRLAATARSRGQEEQKLLQRLRIDREAETSSLKDNAFHSYLAQVPVNELEAYRGIGPATVAKLFDAGYANLNALHNARPRIPGLGLKRITDIEQAVSDLLRKARATFEAGACTPANAPQRPGTAGDQVRSLRGEGARPHECGGTIQ